MWGGSSTDILAPLQDGIQSLSPDQKPQDPATFASRDGLITSGDPGIGLRARLQASLKNHSPKLHRPRVAVKQA